MRRCIALLVIGSSSSNLIDEGVLHVVEIRNTRLQVGTQGLRQQKCQQFRWKFQYVANNADQILNASKHPLDSPEEPSAGSELGRKDSDTGSVSQLVALIEHVRYVESEFE
jgi:hypothetical protein